ADKAVRFADGPEYYREFVAALERRGMIDRPFFELLMDRGDLTADAKLSLQQVAASFGIAIAPRETYSEELLIPAEQLRELREALGDDRATLDFLTYGTEYGDLVRPQENDTHYTLIERLARSTDPAAPAALRWYLERLLEGFDRAKPSWRDPLLGALRVIQGPGTPVPPAEEIGRIPFSMPR